MALNMATVLTVSATRRTPVNREKKNSLLSPSPTFPSSRQNMPAGGNGVP